MPTVEPTDDLIGAAALAISGAVWAAFRMEPSDAAALNVVLAEPGISISRLSRTLGLSHSATVRVADRLELDGLVMRSSPGPGRTVALATTQLGRRRARQAATRRTHVLERATSGFSTAERRSLIELLSTAVRNLAHDQDQIDRACRLCDQRRCLRRGCPLPA